MRGGIVESQAQVKSTNAMQNESIVGIGARYRYIVCSAECGGGERRAEAEVEAERGREITHRVEYR